MGEPVAVAETPEVVKPLGLEPLAVGAMMVELPALYGAPALALMVPVGVKVVSVTVVRVPVVEAEVEAEMVPAE